MKGDGSTPQRCCQGQHLKTLGLPVHQRAHIRRFIGMRTFDLGRVPDHKAGLLVEEHFERLAEIMLLNKPLGTFVIGGWLLRHVGGNIAYERGAGCYDPL